MDEPWCNPLTLIGPAMLWTAMTWNLIALLNMIVRMVACHHYLIVTATMAALR